MKLSHIIKRLPLLGPLALAVCGRRPGRQPSFRDSSNYWETRYRTGGDSGAGSFGRLANFKAETLNQFVSDQNIKTVIEFGCGDGNQLRLANYPAYIGIDVSRQAIRICRRAFSADGTKTFRHSSEYHGNMADLSISLDVVYHLVEDDVFAKYMTDLFDAAARYVVIYSSNHDRLPSNDAPHVRHRNLTRWIEMNQPEWKLIRHLPNRFPFHGDEQDGSFADFYFFQRVVNAGKSRSRQAADQQGGSPNA